MREEPGPLKKYSQRQKTREGGREKTNTITPKMARVYPEGIKNKRHIKGGKK